MPLPQAVAELLAPRGIPLPLQVGVGESLAAPALPTGVAELDALAPGGVPRGRLTEVVARRGGGRTTLLRQLVERTIADGGWVAVIDASRTLSPRDWARSGESGRLWVVRPEDAARAPWCADLLLRSGAFALVVLDAAPPLSRTVAVRLTRLAREAGTAFVVAGEPGIGAAGTTRLAGALRFRVSAIRRTGPHRPQPPQRVPTAIIAVLVEKGGIHRTVEVSCAIELSRRLCTHPEVPDRRGVARRAPGGRGGVGRDGSAVAGGRGTAVARTGDPPPERSTPSPATAWGGHPGSPSPFTRGRRRAATPEYPTSHHRARALG